MGTGSTHTIGFLHLLFDSEFLYILNDFFPNGPGVTAFYFTNFFHVCAGFNSIFLSVSGLPQLVIYTRSPSFPMHAIIYAFPPVCFI